MHNFLYRKKIKNGYKYKYILGICVEKKKLVHISNYVPNGKSFPSLTLIPPGIDNVGKYTYANPDVQIFSKETSIGAFCSIGQKVVIGCGIHPLNFLSSSPYFYFDNLHFKSPSMPSHNEFWDYQPVYIGNDVWIGDGVFIKNGVKVGDGAVLGAHAVVTKDVPPYAIVAGCPAKILRYRFSENIIHKLLKLQWWNLPDEVIKQIPYDNIENAIEFLEGKEIV